MNDRLPVRLVCLGALAALVLALLTANNSTLAADNTPAGQQPSAGAFRRVFVPADSPEDWPRAGNRYLPLSDKEFSRLVNQPADGSEQKEPEQLQIRNATYTAELRQSNQLHVEANFAVEFNGNQAKLQPLAPLNLAIRSAKWQREGTSDAVLGLWRWPDQSLQPAVLVDAPGTLKIEGLLAGQSLSTDRSEFYLDTPTTIHQTLELCLPAHQSASVANAELLRTEQGTLGESRWYFQLSPAQQHHVRIRSINAATDARVIPRVSQATSYQLKPSGLDTLSELRLDAGVANPTRLSAVLPSGTRVVDVTVDQQTLEWDISTAQGVKTLAFRVPPSDRTQLVQVRFLAKLRSAMAWELPKLKFLDVAWTEGTTSLFVAPELELQSLVPVRSTLLHSVGIDEATRKGEVFRLQDWSQDAALKIVVARPQAKLAAQTVTKFRTGQAKPQTLVATRLSTTSGNLYQIQALVRPDWKVDSVRTVPESMLSDWYLNRAGDSTKLFLQLAESISKDRPLYVKINASRSPGLPEFPAVADLEVLRFLAAEQRSNLLALTAENSEQLTLSDQLTEALFNIENSGTSFPTELRGILSADAEDIVLDLSLLEEDSPIAFGQQPPDYRADIQIVVDALPDTIEHRFEINGKMRAGALSKLRLESTLPLPESLQWKLDGEPTPVAMERVAGDAVDQTTAGKWQYLLTFSKPQTEDFRLSAQYSQTSASSQPCNLLQLPSTLNWSGLLSIQGSSTNYQLRDQGLVPSNQIPVLQDNGKLPRLGVYQLSPQDFRPGGATKSVSLKRHATTPVAPQLLAWLAEYQTLQGANGSALHAANFSLENRGSEEVRITLPKGATLEEAWVNDLQLEVQQLVSDGESYVFGLSDETVWQHLSLKYSTRGTVLGRAAQISPLLPECSFPIHHNRWTLWAPEQYEIDDTQQSYSWTKYHWWKRIFGPLARSRSETVFDPTSSDRWSELWSAPLAEQETKRQTGALASQVTTQIEANPTETLSTLLSTLAEKNGIQQRLIIDHPALRARGIATDTLCRDLAAGTTQSDTLFVGAKSIANYQLALLASPGTILLTSPDRVAHWREHVRPTRVSGVYIVESDGLSDNLQQLRDIHSPDFITAGTWPTYLRTTDLRWQGPGSTTLADVGRQAETVEFTDQLPKLVVRRAHEQQALWYAVLLLTIVLGAWQLAHFPNFMIFLGALAGACCLIVPTYWLTIPQAGFLGLLAAAVIRITLKSSQIGTTQGLLSSRGMPSSVASTVLAASCLLGSNTGIAAESASSQLAATASIPSVLVPVDSLGKRQGEDLFVPEQFLLKLQQALSEATDARDVVVLEANYLASHPNSSATNNSSTSSAMGPWTLAWKIETTKPNCKVSLPLYRSEAVWRAADHRLDGLPVTLDWNANGLGCTIDIRDPGMHWLRLVGLPSPVSDGETTFVRLHVPPVPNAKLLVPTNPNPTGLQILGAAQVPTENQSEQTEYLLGPADFIELRWQSRSKNAKIDPWKQLKLLSWLKIDNSESRYDVQLHVTECQPDLQTIQFDVSAPLRLLTDRQSLPLADISAKSVGQSTRVTLALHAGLPRDFVIPLSFELLRSTSIGEIHYPSAEVIGGTADVRHFAVSVASGFSYDERAVADLRKLDPEDFLADWKDPTDAPLFAYAMGQKSAWSLRVRPDPESSTAQQTLRMLCLSDRVKTDYQAEFNLLNGSKLIHRLRVPESLKIDTITVLVGSEVVPSRWSRTNTSQVSVFLSRPLNAKHMLRLRGHHDKRLPDEIDLPLIWLMDSNAGELHLDLYRSDKVQLSWAQPELTPREIEKQSIPDDSDAIYVGHFLWRASQASSLSSLRLQENNLRFKTQSVTTIERENQAWETKLSSRIFVERGVLSRLQLALPKNVGPPFELQPEQVGVIQEVAENADGKQVTILLANPVAPAEQLQLQLSGSLSLPADRSLTVPSLFWSNAFRRERYVQLPSLVDGETINWRRSGLIRRGLPLALQEMVAPTAPSHYFRLERDQFEAKQRVPQGVMLNAQVRFASVSGFLESDGLFAGVASLLVQPGRATHCTIELPNDAQLQKLVVGDQSVSTQAIEGNRLRVALGPPFLPQRILLGYRYRSELAPERVRLMPPKVLLGGQALPTQETYWYIRTPNNLILDGADLGEPISRKDFLGRNQQVPAEIIRDAQTQALELPPAERDAWRNTWQAIERQTAQDWQRPGSSSDRRPGLPTEPRDLRSIASVLAANKPPHNQSTAPLAYPPSTSVALNSTPIPAEYFFVGDSSGQVLSTMTLSSRHSAWQWFAATALICGVLAIVLKLRRHPECYHDLCHWPHSLAFVGGLIWWLLLKPSALGMLVIALTTVSLAIRKWRTYRSLHPPRQGIQLTASTH